MTEMAENKNELRSELIRKGHLQKNMFSWDKTADLMWNCVSKALQSVPARKL
jgi:hypothetical protein